MATTDDQPFRFMDLPGELRNKVYQLLLCSHDAPDMRGVRSLYGDLLMVKGPFYTAILGTSSIVHCEAYDVFLKTTKPVLLQSKGNLPVETTLASSDVAVFPTNEKNVAQFRGYVLEISLSTIVVPKPRGSGFIRSLAPISVMVSAMDMAALCQGIMNAENHTPGFSATAEIIINVAPVLDAPLSRYKGSMDEYFSNQTLETLLSPFTEHLKGYKKLSVIGHVSPALAASVVHNMTQNELSETKEVIQKITHIKERGQAEYHAGSFIAAQQTWASATLDLTRMKKGSSWEPLIARGGEAFIAEVAELEFLLYLNIAQVGIKI
jgi:hypothetical protein